MKNINNKSTSSRLIIVIQTKHPYITQQPPIHYKATNSTVRITDIKHLRFRFLGFVVSI